jgi:hypothetical protein
MEVSGEIQKLMEIEIGCFKTNLLTSYSNTDRNMYIYNFLDEKSENFIGFEEDKEIKGYFYFKTCS